MKYLVKLFYQLPIVVDTGDWCTVYHYGYYSSLSLFSSVNCFSLSLFTEDPNEHHDGAVGQQL